MLAWFVKNKEVSLALTILVLFCGVVSFSLLQFEVMPDTRLQIIEVECTNFGASPSDMDSSMISPLESKILEIDSISKVISQIFDSKGLIEVHLGSKSNPDKVISIIKDKIDRINFPSESEKIKVNQKILKTEVLQIALQGDQSWENKLSLAREIKEKLTKVASVEIVGKKFNKLNIEFLDDVFLKYNLTSEKIASIIQRSFETLTLGEVDGETLTVRSSSENLDYYHTIPLIVSEHGSVLLGDIADIRFDTDDQITRFNGKDALILKVYGENALKISSFVKKYVYDNEDITIFEDNADLLKSRLSMMGFSLLWSFLVVCTLLWVFLSPKVGIFSSLGIIVSFSGTIVVMALMGISINMVSLFAFILVLGIIVDDSIIIGESIQKKIEEGENSLNASIEGASLSFRAVSGATLTNLIFFGCLILVSGSTGLWFQSLVVVVISALLFSLVEAYLLMPSHMAHYSLGKKIKRGIFFPRIKAEYSHFLGKVLRNKYKFLVGCFGLFFSIVLLLTSGMISFKAVDTDSLDTVMMSIKMPYGTNFEDFNEKIKFCEDSLKEVSENKVKYMLTNISEPTNGVPLIGTIVAKLEEVSASIESKWREKTGYLEGAYVDFGGSMFGTSNEIEFELQSSDREALNKAIKVFKNRLREHLGVFYVYDDFFEGRKELGLKLTPYAHFAGLSLSNVAHQVRSSLYGCEALRFIKHGEEVRVIVKVNSENIEDLPIKVGDGFVSLKQVADLVPQKGPSFISKSSGLIVIKVKAVHDSSFSFGKDIISDFKKEFPTVNARLSGIHGEKQEVMRDLSKLMLMGFFCAYIVLVLILKDFFYPSIILYSIPLSLIGVMLGHWVLGMTLSVNSIVGFMAVSGIALNDSLVLLDTIRIKINKEDIVNSLIEACESRLRPIILTTITTSIGVSSIFFSSDARMLFPIAVSIIFGLVFAMLVNIFFVPCIYLFQLSLREVFFRIQRKFSMTLSVKRNQY